MFVIVSSSWEWYLVKEIVRADAIRDLPRMIEMSQRNVLNSSKHIEILDDVLSVMAIESNQSDPSFRHLR